MVPAAYRGPQEATAISLKILAEVKFQYLELPSGAEVPYFLYYVLLEERVCQGLFRRAAVLGFHHQEARHL